MRSEAEFYCGDCHAHHPLTAPKVHCQVCNHTVCEKQYQAHHTPQDWHQVAAVLSAQADTLAQAVDEIDEWIADEAIPLGADARHALDLARASLHTEHHLLVQMRDAAKERKVLQF